MATDVSHARILELNHRPFRKGTYVGLIDALLESERRGRFTFSGSVPPPAVSAQKLLGILATPARD